MISGIIVFEKRRHLALVQFMVNFDRGQALTTVTDTLPYVCPYGLRFIDPLVRSYAYGGFCGRQKYGIFIKIVHFYTDDSSFISHQ